MRIVFATNNHHKTREIRNILGNDIDLLTLNDINITDDIPENEPTLEGNAMHKARFVYDRILSTVFADDTGLEVEALDGRPGVKSARFAGENKDPDANIDKLLSLLEGSDNRKARFRTVIALVHQGNEYLFDGIVEGEILTEKRGSGGFGYDPVFVPEGGKLTFAEMSLDAKNKLSHRARAFQKLKDFISVNLLSDNKGRI